MSGSKVESEKDEDNDEEQEEEEEEENVDEEEEEEGEIEDEGGRSLASSNAERIRGKEGERRTRSERRKSTRGSSPAASMV